MNKRLFLAATLIALSTLCSSAVAQEHGPPAGGPDKNLKEAASDVKGRSIEMDRIAREAKNSKTEKHNDPPVMNFDEIKEDFERIQIINSDILQPTVSKASIDYQRVFESAEEIERRGIRLRTNLFGAPREKQAKDKKPAVQNQELKSLVTSLEDSIDNFAHNPMFQNTQTVTADDSAAAQKSLEEVIKISTGLKTEADRLKKTNTPPNQ